MKNLEEGVRPGAASATLPMATAGKPRRGSNGTAGNRQIEYVRRSKFRVRAMGMLPRMGTFAMAV